MPKNPNRKMWMPKLKLKANIKHTETIPEFLARGGKIRYICSGAAKIEANIIPMGKYISWPAYYKELKKRKKPVQKRWQWKA